MLFIALYVSTCIFLLPGGLLTIGGGALFGVAAGGLYVLLGVNVGAALSFLVARRFFRPFAEKKLHSHPRLSRIAAGIENEGWKAILLVRLCPLFPFRLTNYALGATNISLGDFMWGTFLGTLPSALTYVSLGALGGRISDSLVSGRMQPYLIIPFGIVGTLAFFTLLQRLSKAAERALQKKA
jgi:uncharacterized membrane protein YdjX (TVP38/TMEM64 family)